MSFCAYFKIDKQDLRWIIRIFLFAFIVKLIYFIQFSATRAYPFVEYSDSHAYFYWARDIAGGDFLGSGAFMKWPLYAYLVAGILKISKNSPLPVFLLQLFLGAINCVFTYALARYFIGKRWPAILAGLVCALYGLFTFYDTVLVYTTVSLFLNFIFIFYVLKIQDRTNALRFFICGILLGIAAIAQANIVPCGMFLMAWLLFKSRCSPRNSLRIYICFLAGAVLITGTVTLRNYLVERDFVPITGHIGLNFYSGNNQKATGTFFSPQEITLNPEDMFRDAKIIARLELNRDLKTSQVSDFWFKKALRFIQENPKEAAGLLLKKAMFIFSPREYMHDVEYYFRENKIGVSGLLLKDLRFMMPFVILGMALGLKRIRLLLPLYIIVFTLSLSIVLFYVTARYRLSLVPFFIIFAAYAANDILERIKEKQYFRFWVIFSILIGFGLLCNKVYDFRDKPTPSGATEALMEQHMLQALGYENAGEYHNALKELGQADAILPHNRRVLFRQGVILFKLGDLALAEEKFKEVIKINPVSVDAYYNLGFIYNQKMQFNKAKGLLEYAVFLDPDDAKAHFELATAYKETGDYKKAKEQLYIALNKLSRWQVFDRQLILKELENLK